MVVTTIQVDVELVEELKKRKLYGRESYADVIWDLIEDNMELNEETKRDMAEARAQYERGEYYTFDEVKKHLGMK